MATPKNPFDGFDETADPFLELERIVPQAGGPPHDQTAVERMEAYDTAWLAARRLQKVPYIYILESGGQDPYLWHLEQMINGMPVPAIFLMPFYADLVALLPAAKPRS
jgi:hypothetical protein